MLVQTGRASWIHSRSSLPFSFSPAPNPAVPDRTLPLLVTTSPQCLHLTAWTSLYLMVEASWSLGMLLHRCPLSSRLDSIHLTNSSLRIPEL